MAHENGCLVVNCQKKKVPICMLQNQNVLRCAASGWTKTKHADMANLAIVSDTTSGEIAVGREFF